MSPRNKGDSGDNFVQEHNESRFDFLAEEDEPDETILRITEVWCACGKKPCYVETGTETPTFKYNCSANCILFAITGEHFQQVSKAMEGRIMHMVTSGESTTNRLDMKIDRTGELPKGISYVVGDTTGQASQGAEASSGNINPEKKLEQLSSQTPEDGNPKQDSVEQKQ